MNGTPAVYRAVVALPELGIEAGEDVVFHPGAPRLLTLCKDLPQQQAFYLATQAGHIVPLGGAPTGPALRALLPNVTPMPAPRRRLPALHLVLVEGGAR